MRFPFILSIGTEHITFISKLLLVDSQNMCICTNDLRDLCELCIKAILRLWEWGERRAAVLPVLSVYLFQKFLQRSAKTDDGTKTCASLIHLRTHMQM